MNDFVQPYPPLAVLAARLLDDAVTDEGEIVSEAEIPDPIDPEPAISLPGWLQHQIHQVATCCSRNAPVAPAPGQIWSLAYQGQLDGKVLAGRIPILLNHALGEDCWQGWIVCSETDYAATDDLILDVDGCALAPVARMVQTWNTVRARWSDAAPYLGELPADQLASVRRVAAFANQPGATPGAPCQLHWRDLEPGWSVLTGQALGKANDPRWAYRQLYRRFALACLLELSSEQEFDV